MENNAHGFLNVNTNQSLLIGNDPLYRFSSNVHNMDDRIHLHLPQTSSQTAYGHHVSTDAPSDYMNMNRMQSEQYPPSHVYFQGSNSNLTPHHRYVNFDQVPDNDSRKHSITGVVRTRRRKAGISDEERVCIVCGEPASGYNFDRLTCESCKAFFRRNALKPRDKIKACSRGGGCTIEGNQRKHCPSCRLEKCLSVGMKRELILPPEKLEQRAKPRRRKHHSPRDSNSSPQHLLTGPSSVGSSNTNMYPPYLPSPHNSLVPAVQPSNTYQSLLVPPSVSAHVNSREFTHYQNSNQSNDISLLSSGQFSSAMENNEHNFHAGNLTEATLTEKSSQLFEPSTDQTQNEPRKQWPLTVSQNDCKLKPNPNTVRCRRTHGRTVCKHRSCRILSRRRVQKLQTYSSSSCLLKLNSYSSIMSPDPHLLNCLQDCIRRIREPFTPEEQLETGVAVTLEQEYNRMDACIRRIIRVVKLLPYFGDVGKPTQLNLLRSNIYGLIVLCSSFYFERDIKKLRYPVLQSDGQLTTVTVSMLDEVVTPTSSTMTDVEDGHSDPDQKYTHPYSLRSGSLGRSCHNVYGLREEFELYKANTLAAYDHLDQLVGSDDILRMCVLAIKLFTDNSFPDDMRASVCAARQTYSIFLWNYIRWQAGPKKLRSATELYARLLIAFIDLRTLEIRMTEFARFLSLDGLSPLMREVCSQRNTFGSPCP